MAYGQEPQDIYGKKSSSDGNYVITDRKRVNYTVGAGRDGTQSRAKTINIYSWQPKQQAAAPAPATAPTAARMAAPAFNPVNPDGSLKQIQTFAGTGLGAPTANPQYDATKFIKMGGKDGVSQYAHRTPENLAILNARTTGQHAQTAQDNFAAMTQAAQPAEPAGPTIEEQIAILQQGFDKALKDMTDASDKRFNDLQAAQALNSAKLLADQRAYQQNLATGQRTYQQNQSRSGQMGALQIGGAGNTPRTGGTQGFKRRKLQINPATSNALSGAATQPTTNLNV